ncbi:hypothetical protein TNIN_299721 [Trichonephila inaurata madagascariensis]|uniref:Uncharacterized protein n=1 Tax=Trichonephila inaurata madagascariensis TaxID=2747483 RepID=A0A8X6XJ22_9ARAC|nr:hypothetical protein TNIN_299721 [Trichonephila inaurata madagascariensis]
MHQILIPGSKKAIHWDVLTSNNHLHITPSFLQQAFHLFTVSHRGIGGGLLPICKCFRYMLTMVDRFSSWNEGLPETDQSAETVAKGMISIWISHFGAPQRIPSAS